MSGVVGRADLLSACLSLIVFIIYNRAAKQKQISTITNIITTIMCCILSALAMLCKEQGLMIMVIIKDRHHYVFNELIQILIKYLFIFRLFVVSTKWFLLIKSPFKVLLKVIKSPRLNYLKKNQLKGYSYWLLVFLLFFTSDGLLWAHLQFFNKLIILHHF